MQDKLKRRIEEARRTEADSQLALTLEELLAGVSDENLHDEVPTGPPVGRETGSHFR